MFRAGQKKKEKKERKGRCSSCDKGVIVVDRQKEKAKLNSSFFHNCSQIGKDKNKY